MVNCHGSFKFFLISLTVVSGVLVQSPAEEESPLLEIAQSLLQESVRNQNGNSGLNVLSGLMQGFMQSEGGKQLGDMLTKNKGGSVDLLANLASIWQASKFNFATTDETGTKRDLNIDPSILGSVVDLFSSLNRPTNDIDDNEVHHHDEEDQLKRPNNENNPVDWMSMLSFAGNIMSSMSSANTQSNENSGSAGGLETFLSLLSVVMNSISGEHNVHLSHSIPHHTHAPFLPPILENLHEYWDHFTSTEFGKTLWKKSGLSNLVASFTNIHGELEMNKVFESLENNNIRRQWIKSVSSFIAQWAKHFTNPETQKSYLETGRMVFNSFLSSQGYSNDALIDLNKPVKSISKLINTVVKRKFGTDVNSETYVLPVVSYIQELFKIGQNKGFKILKLSSNDIETKLSETMETDVIEPIVRVNRAYRFALRRPECSNFVMCVVNQNNDDTKSGLKPGINKLSSLTASWFLSNSEKISFWELYNAVVENKNCAKFDQQCSEFYEEDLKATTEYYHNEL